MIIIRVHRVLVSLCILKIKFQALESPWNVLEVECSVFLYFRQSFTLLLSTADFYCFTMDYKCCHVNNLLLSLVKYVSTLKYIFHSNFWCSAGMICVCSDTLVLANCNFRSLKVFEKSLSIVLSVCYELWIIVGLCHSVVVFVFRYISWRTCCWQNIYCDAGKPCCSQRYCGFRHKNFFSES